MADLTDLESAWLIWSGETGVEMDEAFADCSTPQEWLDAGIFPGDHELLMLQGFAPRDVRSMRLIPACPRLVSWLAIALIEILRHLKPCSGIFLLIFRTGRCSLQHFINFLSQQHIN